MEIMRRADYRRMAWKNGQGVTEEVDVVPPDCGLEDFVCRLSIAHVAADGPFSRFPGIDRTIALLEGPGLALHLPDGRAVVLAPGGPPFSFPGEWEMASRNLGGPTIDFNVMTRRGACRHEMQRVVLAAGGAFGAPSPGWAVLNTALRIAAGGEALSLDRFDTLTLGEGDGFVSLDDTPAEILFVTIED